MQEFPNILLITTDQQRYDTLGCTGNKVIQTPHLDRLAAQGVIFSDLHVQNTLCAPSRACLATGRMPFSLGIHNNGSILPTTERTMMQQLTDNGYSTAGFGKMHFRPQKAGLHHDSDRIPEQPSEYPYYGFQECRLTEDTRVGPYTEYLTAHGIDQRVDIDSGDKGQWKVFTANIPEEHHQTTWVADRTLDYLSKVDRSKPFFVWTSFVDPHHPFCAPPPYDSMYDPAQMPLPLWSAEEEDRLAEEYCLLRYGRGDDQESVDFSQFNDHEWQRIKASYYGMISLIDEIDLSKILITLRSKEWRYTYHVGNRYGELYDLQQDPHELETLWNDAKYADRKAECLRRCLDRILLDRDPLPEKIAIW